MMQTRVGQIDSHFPEWMNLLDNEEVLLVENQRQINRYRTIFISDTHLGSKGAKADHLSHFLKFNECEKLYLVGDIVDGWRLKKRIFWPQAHTNVLRRILTKSKRGTQVVYVTGNHDDFLRRYSGVEFGNIQLCDQCEFVAQNGKRFLVVHGDQYDEVIQSQKWLAILGDWSYETLVVLNRYYNGWRKKLGLNYWSLSAFLKQKVKKAVAFISAYEDAVVKDCKKLGYQGVICGHIHHPEIRQVQGVEYFNCGDWVESCTAIVETLEGEMKLLQWVEIDHHNND